MVSGERYPHEASPDPRRGPVGSSRLVFFGVEQPAPWNLASAHAQPHIHDICGLEKGQLDDGNWPETPGFGL